MDQHQNSPDHVADNAKNASRDAMDKVKEVASDAKSAAQDAADTGRAYAKDAVNAAGKKLDSVKSQLGQSCESLTKAINDEPVKAVIVAAVLSSAITALLVSALRSDDRYF